VIDCVRPSGPRSAVSAAIGQGCAPRRSGSGMPIKALIGTPSHARPGSDVDESLFRLRNQAGEEQPQGSRAWRCCGGPDGVRFQALTLNRLRHRASDDP